ncbi:MAG: isoleucine--tRNA ligase [Candidatus Didemnitutus sp.]|nr:isoleucine--tRNA ligase [Candidatus Didemnitutus sp.]
MAQELKDTLLLPKTDFPMRANLVQREPQRISHWEKLDLYARIQARRAGSGKKYVLHDGPPFTNGDVHIGTALNKSLKDFVNRYKSMQGFATPYVPGWDCHGLPIEQKVSREIQEQKLNLTTAELRAKCDAFSEGWIAKQTAQFKRIGVLADWAHEYKTKAPAFEADVLRTFAAFVAQGLVYRSKKPVYWSIPFETALAEAEIEYKDHVSPSIWVKFAVPEFSKLGVPTSIVIWTTTPWTLPANLAIAVHPNIDYSYVADKAADGKDEVFIVASALVEQFKTAVNRPNAQVTGTISGGVLGKHPEFGGGAMARHPFIDRDVPIVQADYVTTDSGTGCVHTAPGHGAEDYQTGLKYGLPIYCPVGDDGKYLDDGQVPADLVGLTCLESVEDLAAKKTSPANIAVLKKLAGVGALLAKQNLSHSYPHCWRSKTPIVFRAVDQWFVSLDKAGHRQIALGEITKIAQAQGWIPAWGEARIRGAVESRPDWCISRQRSWGVPIIAFYGPDKQAYIDADVIRAVADKIATKGTNFWYDAPTSEILAGVTLPAGWPAAAELTCGRDTLDVWIDSGSTQAAVLQRGQGGTHWPADLYLEGSDQHRGWFQSSLWCSVIAFGAAPYKNVLTHGFIVDKNRQKISKSSTYQKPQTAEAYIKDHGADVIRLWIASQDFRDDIPVDEEILKNVGEAYRLFRNTFRFQLSTLFDFDAAQHAVPYAQLDALDRWALHQTAKLLAECTQAYDAFEFHRVYQLCNQFCSVTLSAVYHDILKDRLYTLGAAHPLRRSSQTAIHQIFRTLVRILAPVLTFTADEAWSFATTGKEYSDDSVHLQDWPVAPAEWTDAALDTEFAALLKLRAKVTESLEPLRQAGTIGKSLDAVLTFAGFAADGTSAALEKHRASLAEFFIVSQVAVEPNPAAALEIKAFNARETGHNRCPRCWRWVPALTATPHGDICPRCAEALP